MAPQPLVALRGLAVAFDGQAALRGLDLDVMPGEAVGLVGESGCGKSVTWLAALGLLPAHAAVSGSVRLAGQELLGAPAALLERVRGGRIAMIFQDPASSLNPVHRIGAQVTEALALHRGLTGASAPAEARRLLDQVGMPDAARRLDAWPHELSGGQNQRAMIAIALAGRPELLVADEPTTALDVTIQAQILELLGRLRRETGMALVLISHDLGVVSETCDRVAVMYAGRIVEEAPAAALFARPAHPYTRGLLGALPPMDGPRRRLTAIPGGVPEPWAMPPGCAFAPRCPHRVGACDAAVPEARAVAEAHRAACIRATVAALLEGGCRRMRPAAPLLRAEGLVRRYAMRRGMFGRSLELRAVDGVSLTLERGRTLGLVGESGCGKSTTGRLVLGLEVPDAGAVAVEGQPMPAPGSAAWRAMRARMQMVFQDPLGALDRRLPVGAQVAEPLEIHRIGGAAERAARVEELLRAVGLRPDQAARYPHELSGGQRQRAVIARALATAPALLVCDEPISALDVSIQAQVMNLLVELQDRFGMGMLFVSHDLRAVRQVSHRVAVMYLGRIVEEGEPDAVLHDPAHPYVRALVSAIPHPGRPSARIVLQGDPPSPAERPAGCAFHPRCPVASALCAAEAPALKPRRSDGRLVACHVAQGEAPAGRGVPAMAAEMLRFAVTRLLRAALTIAMVVTFAFVVLRLSGDPAEVIMGPDAPPEAIAAFRAAWGLDQPILVQYLSYFWAILQGDLGRSMRDGRDAIVLVAERIPATLALTVPALAVKLLIGIPAGMYAALHRNSLADRMVMVLAVAGFTVPSFVLGLILVLVFAVQLGWLPSGGQEGLAHAVLPVVTLGLGGAAVLARFTRSAMLEVLGQPYIRTASAKGVPWRAVVTRHALPNAAIPTVTIVGFMVGSLIAGAVVVESVFSWPGVGRLLVVAVGNRDLAVVQCILLLVAATMVLANLLVDLLYGLLDPRLRSAPRAAAD